jgi:hypothetical protein
MPARDVHFVELDRGRAEAVLARNHVGRLAYCSGTKVGVRPLHYVFRDGWIYGRTTEGEKIDALRSNWWVGFEVDEVDGAFDWRSVIVHGGFYALAPRGAESERQRYERAVDTLRSALPDAFTAADPVPERTLVFGIAVQELSGRMAWTAEQEPIIPSAQPPAERKGV